MSFFVQAWLLDRYGPRLTMRQVAEALGVGESTVRNRIAAGTITLRTYLDGGSRFADARDVAEYLDECRASSRAEVVRIA